VKQILAVLFACGLVLGQNVQTVAISGGPPNAAFTLLGFYPSSTTTYFCRAAAQPALTYAWGVTAVVGQGTLTNITVSANVGTITTTAAHGLAIGNVVNVSGSTTAALNGNYIIQSVGSTTTFTITTSAVSNATYATAALKVSTVAPRTSSTTGWSINRITLDGSGNVTASQWATSVVTGAGGATSFTFSCDARAGYGYQ